MIETIQKFEESLKAQLERLEKDVRELEIRLVIAKEGCLKVQGALEILSLLKTDQALVEDQIDLDRECRD